MLAGDCRAATTGGAASGGPGSQAGSGGLVGLVCRDQILNILPPSSPVRPGDQLGLGCPGRDGVSRLELLQLELLQHQHLEVPLLTSKHGVTLSINVGLQSNIKPAARLD